jgi:hypothetical protein
MLAQELLYFSDKIATGWLLAARSSIAMLHEKEAFESSINGLTAFIEQDTQNCHCFDETELEKKIHEIEVLNANLDVNFLTLQNISEFNNVKPHEVLDFYTKLGDTKSNVKLALNNLKDSNDLIKFLKIEIEHDWLRQVKSELLENTVLSTREKILVWCGVLERAEKNNAENLALREILYKELMLVKTRFLKPAERNQSYEKKLDAFQHLFGVRECSRGNRRTP